MFLGLTTFKCDDCNNIFSGLHIESEATFYPMLMTCPKCNGQHTYPPGRKLSGIRFGGYSRDFYKKYGKKRIKTKGNKIVNRFPYKMHTAVKNNDSIF